VVVINTTGTLAGGTAAIGMGITITDMPTITITPTTISTCK
jgi:hypothetical protein